MVTTPCGIFIFHWQDLKDDLDIDYIWAFISICVSRGIGEPKKSKLPFPSVGQFFMTRSKRSISCVIKTFPKNVKIVLFGLILNQIADKFQKRPPLVFSYTLFKSYCAKHSFFAIFSQLLKSSFYFE